VTINVTCTFNLYILKSVGTKGRVQFIDLMKPLKCFGNTVLEVCVYKEHITKFIKYSCNIHFQRYYSSSMSHDPSEIILACWFAAKEPLVLSSMLEINVLH